MADIVYTFEGSVYLNITNSCPCKCKFCIRNNSDSVGDADTLWFSGHNPSFDEIKKAIDEYDFTGYNGEVIFCGYGEPTFAYDNLIKTCKEIHSSLYTYTIAIDLDRVGIDGDITVNKEERAERVKKLLDTIEFLYRDIKGRRENMSPVFAIGGLYERKNPYFENRIKSDRMKLDVEMIDSVIQSSDDTKNNTHVGMLKGKFANEEEINKLEPVTISEVFAILKKEVDEYYA